MKRIILNTLAVLLVTAACSPWRSFDKKKQPPVPDYNSESNWIALPWKKDAADSVPPGCNIKENQNNAKVDVFYIHPTMYLTGHHWNGNVNKKSLNKKSEHCALFQASAFNAAGKIYIPRYRQAILKSFIDTTNGEKALKLAYADVKAAFEYYLKNWNKGRPIIIAGHSQGARHAVQLLKDFFDGTELQKQLVAAYPIGMPIKKNEFKNIPLSDSAAQINCFVTWNTFSWGTEYNKVNKRYKGRATVNPLTWKPDEVYASAQHNQGGLPFTYKHIDKAVCDAQVHDGMLWIHRPEKPGYYKVVHSYHVSDYALFYMNIRENALLRTSVFLKTKTH